MIFKQGSKTYNIKVKEGETILDAIKRSDIVFCAPCNGHGLCGKCDVKIDGKIYKACKTIAKDEYIIEIEDQKFNVLSSFVDSSFDIDQGNGVGLVLDLGTTTLVYSFLDLKTGQELKNVTLPNPQSKYGIDVISRVEYCTKNGIEKLYTSINLLTKNVINNILDELKINNLERMIVSGNTIMLHTFINKDISSFGYYPFTPNFLTKQILSGFDLGLKVNEVIVMPSFSSFVGGDLVSGMIASNLKTKDNILIDIGTNGEIISSINNKLVVTSVAAGPAFEGSNIECGSGGINGAISHFYLDNEDNLQYEVIGNCAPKSICGSALVDIISILVDKKIIDSDGLLKTDDHKFFITENIYISQKDIRNIQLAKSAICSGIKTLIKINNINVDNLDKIFISGGFGSFLNLENAIKIKMLPEFFKDKYKVLGNTSLLGGVMCLLNKESLSKAEKESKCCEVVELSTNQDFSEMFIENLSF